MRSRWPRILPGYPAVLLVPAVLGAWATACMVRRYALDLDYVTAGWGFPLPFYLWGEFKLSPFLADLVLALATGYIVAMGVERLLFPAVRAARRGKRGTGEAG